MRDAIDSLVRLAKGGPHKYKSRKKVKGKWVYEYDQPKGKAKGKSKAKGGKWTSPDQARARGAEAHAAGIGSASAMDPEFMARLPKGEVGSAIKYLDAWSRGWHVANAKANSESKEGKAVAADMARTKLESEAWNKEHPDFRSTIDGVRHVMVNSGTGAAVLSPMASLTDFELAKEITGSATKASAMIDPHNPTPKERERIVATADKLWDSERDYDGSVIWAVKYAAYRALADGIEAAERRFGKDHPVVPPSLRDRVAEMRNVFANREAEARKRGRENPDKATFTQLQEAAGKRMATAAGQIAGVESSSAYTHPDGTQELSLVVDKTLPQARIDQIMNLVAAELVGSSDPDPIVRQGSATQRGNISVFVQPSKAAAAIIAKQNAKQKKPESATEQALKDLAAASVTKNSPIKMDANAQAEQKKIDRAYGEAQGKLAQAHVEAVNDALSALHDPRNKTKDKTPRGAAVVGALDKIIRAEHNDHLRPVDRSKIKKELNRHLKAARKHYRNMSQSQYRNSPGDSSRQITGPDINNARRLRDNLVATIRTLNRGAAKKKGSGGAAAKKGQATKAKNRRARAESAYRSSTDAELAETTRRNRETGGGMKAEDPLEAWRKKKAEMDKKSEGLDAVDGLNTLMKAGPHKYKSRKKVKGKWVYDYGDKGGSKRSGKYTGDFGIAGLNKDRRDLVSNVEALDALLEDGSKKKGWEHATVEGVAGAISGLNAAISNKLGSKIEQLSKVGTPEADEQIKRATAMREQYRSAAADAVERAAGKGTGADYKAINALTKDPQDLGSETGDLIYGLYANSNGMPIHVKGLGAAYDLSDNDALKLLTRLARVGIVTRDEKTPTAFHANDDTIRQYVKQDGNKLIGKSADAIGDLETLSKGVQRGGKYYKRVPKAGGKGYSYYYTKEEYDKKRGGESDTDPKAREKAQKIVDLFHEHHLKQWDKEKGPAAAQAFRAVPMDEIKSAIAWAKDHGDAKIERALGSARNVHTELEMREMRSKSKKSADAIDGLETLSKGPHKYKSRKKVGGKWVYDYGTKGKPKVAYAKRGYEEWSKDFEAQVSEAADLWFQRASRATQQGQSVNFNLYYTESSPGKKGQLHILHADDTPGPNMKLGDPQAMRGDLTRDQARAKIHTAARRLPIVDPTSYKSADAIEGLERLTGEEHMAKSKGDVIQELIAKMEAGNISEELIGKMKAIGIQDDVIQQLIGKCNTRKSHFEPSLKKGLYAFEVDGKGRKLSDNLLPQYLAAFVEQAFEHEKRECEHMENKPAGYTDQLTFYAQRIMNELVMYMRNNPDLMAAGKDATGETIAAILRNSGLIQPDVSGFDNPEGNGWSGEASLVRSGASPWLQDDPTVRPAAQMADHHKQASYIDDTEDPAIALRKSNEAKRRRAFTAPEPKFMVKGDGACPIHGYGDLTKMQNLVTPMGKCTCN